jgi:hypothetical protein
MSRPGGNPHDVTLQGLEPLQRHIDGDWVSAGGG